MKLISLILHKVPIMIILSGFLLSGCQSPQPIMITKQSLPATSQTVKPSPVASATIQPQEIEILPTSTQTQTRVKPTDTVSLPSPAFELKELIYYAPGAGGAGDCPGAMPEDILPTGEFGSVAPFDTMHQSRLLCLYGFSEGEIVTIELFNPEGIKETELLYQPLEIHPSVWDGRLMTVIGIQVNPDLFFPNGQWKIIARGQDGMVELVLPVGICPDVDENIPHATNSYDYLAKHYVSVQSLTHPPETFFDPAGYSRFTSDDSIRIRGSCYPPKTQMLVGLYHSSQKGQGMSYNLVNSLVVKTDPNGSFDEVVDLAGLFQEAGGGYYAILPVPEGMRPALEGDFANIEVLPFAGFELIPMPDKLDCLKKAILRIANRALVKVPEGIYSGPYQIESGPVGEVPFYEIVTIMDGPVCSGEDVWWQIYAPESGLAGWVNQSGIEPLD